MKQYLTKFNTQEEYDAFKYDPSRSETNVSYIIETDDVEYLKDDIDTTPFTIIINETYNNDPDYMVFHFTKVSDDGDYLMFKKNDEDWITYDSGQLANLWDHIDLGEFSLSPGDIVQIKGHKISNFRFDFYYDHIEGGYEDGDARIGLAGNILSVLTDEYALDTIPEWKQNFLEFFQGNGYIQNIHDLWLPKHGLNDDMFRSMFAHCPNLTDVPAQTFNLSFAPYRLFMAMFRECPNLLYANDLVINIYKQFNIGKEAWETFTSMFHGCSNLVSGATINSIPSNSAADFGKNGDGINTGLFHYMYSGCSSLIDFNIHIPSLILTSDHYDTMTEMFKNTNITASPDSLPAIFAHQFFGDDMFNGCSNLLYTPEMYIPVTWGNNFERMFKGCTRLQAIYFMSPLMDGENRFSEWLSDVPSTCTFYISPLRDYNPNDFLDADGNRLPTWMNIEEAAAQLHYKGYYRTQNDWTHGPGDIEGVTENYNEYGEYHSTIGNAMDKVYDTLGPYHMNYVIDELIIDGVVTPVTWTDTGSTIQNMPVYVSDIEVNEHPIYMYDGNYRSLYYRNNMPGLFVAGERMGMGYHNPKIELNLDGTYDPVNHVRTPLNSINN